MPTNSEDLEAEGDEAAEAAPARGVEIHGPHGKDFIPGGDLAIANDDSGALVIADGDTVVFVAAPGAWTRAVRAGAPVP